VQSEPKVSVIIPVYNGEKMLRKCLGSVLEQTYKDYEVIVVDNNSTDKTKQIISSFQNSCDKIRYVFAARRSVGQARNKGIEASVGDIFVFTYADCICPHQWIEQITFPIRVEGEDAVIGFQEDLVNNYWTRNIQESDEIYMQRSGCGKYTTAFDGKNAAVRAGLMKVLMFDPSIRLIDDLDLGIRIARKTKIRYLPSLRVGHFHQNRMAGVIKTHFSRAFWAFKIYRKYEKDGDIGKNIMFENLSLGKWIIFPFWTLFQFVKRPPGQAFFIFVTEVSWREGLLWSLVKRY
jgi:glycosyltransferase involved in cell wall biosynthesis